MSVLSMLAQSSMADPRNAWLPVVLLVILGLGFGFGNLILSIIIGPRRTGPGKASTYESGMVPIGDARRRFNVRFYVIAMIFLVFDVEIVFFYPWTTIFAGSLAGDGMSSGLLLAEMLIFVAILMVAYLYAWGKGVFRWD